MESHEKQLAAELAKTIMPLNSSLNNSVKCILNTFSTAIFLPLKQILPYKHFLKEKMKLPFFKLGEALSDVKTEFAHGNFIDKTGSIAKLAGKTVANVGMLAVEAGVHIVKNAPEILGKQAEKTLKENRNLTEEQRSKLEEIAKKGRESKN